MAVTFDLASSSTGNGVETLTFAHTTANQSNRIIIVGVSWLDLSTAGLTISTITYGGIGCTFLANALNGPNSEIWYLYAPATGANNVVITWIGDGIGEGGARVVAGAATFYGVAQSAGVGTPAVATGATSPITVDVAGTTSGNFVVDVAHLFSITGTPTLTVGASQTSHWNAQVGGQTSRVIGAGSREAANGTITMSWTESANKTWATTAVEIKAAAAAVTGGPVSSTLTTLTGVGL